MKTKLTTAVAIALMVGTPSQEAIPQESPPNEQESVLPLCIVAVAGLAVGAIYLVSKKCQPKYYWLMDNESPPNYWVGTATRKECEIKDWKRIGGPYNKPSDAPAQHPPPTNRVDNIVGPIVKTQVQESNDGHNWAMVYSEVGDSEDFGYFPTNTNGPAMFYRLEQGAP